MFLLFREFAVYGACRGTQGSHFARRRCPSVIALRAKLRSVAISVPYPLRGSRPRGVSYAASPPPPLLLARCIIIPEYLLKKKRAFSLRAVSIRRRQAQKSAFMPPSGAYGALRARRATKTVLALKACFFITSNFLNRYANYRVLCCA